VTWPDGSSALLWRTTRIDAMGLAVMPGASRAGTLVGLLGDFDGSKANDLTTREGKRIDVAGKSKAQVMSLLYDTFGNSWRIAQGKSLFDYGPGKSTRSFTDKRFPKGYLTLASLSPEERAHAEAVCRGAGVTDPVVLQNCILDVGATGNAGFAEAAVELQVARQPPAPVSWVQLSSASTRRGGPPTLATEPGHVLTAYALSASGTIEVAGFAPAATGPGDVTRTTPISGWTALFDEPQLLPAAGGGLQLLFDGSRSSNAGDISGTALAQRASDGSFGPPSQATGSYEAGLRVGRGAANAQSTDLSGFTHGSVYAPRLAYDATGRLWLAWGQLADDADSGIYMLQLDPATGGPLSGATALRAPSSASANTDEGPVGMACTASCAVLYRQGTSASASPPTLVAWAPGLAQPVVVVPRGDDPRVLAAAVHPDGQVWTVWKELGNTLIHVKLGSGAARRIPAPGSASTALSAVAAVDVGGALVLVARTVETDNTHGIWAAVYAPGR
jgi:hypothetical protein